MKFMVVLFSLFLLSVRIHCDENSTAITSYDTSTTVEDTTEGSADITSEAPQTDGTVKPETPCDSVPCENGGTCDVVGDSFICACSDNWTGSTCSTSTQCETAYRSISTNDSCSDDDNSTLVEVEFQAVRIGEVSLGNRTCNACDGGQSTSPYASLRCVVDENGSTGFEASPQVIDCSASYDDLKTTDDKAQYLAVTTSNNVTNPSGVLESVTTLSQEEDLSDQTATNLLTTINNVLVTEEMALTSDDSENLITTMNNIAKNVDVASGETFSDIQSEVALVVTVADTTTRRKRATGDDVYFGTDNLLDGDVNLALNNFKFSTSKPTGSYAKAANSGRVSFQTYSSSSPIFSGENFAITETKIAFGVTGEGDKEFSFQYSGESNFSTINNDWNFNKSNGLRCVREDSSTWKDVGCQRVSNADGFLTCTCKEEGLYTLRMVSIDSPDDSLSGGAIAGIVIGCVVGAALIGGLIFYLVKRNKKKKAKKVKPIDHASEYGGTHRNEGYDSD